ncbi:hypothetical protein [Methylibium sp.]|uniref:hypothetical protein n=1 Tax=Methylibium sp. TaxID=2067992 RepID=UPI003D0C0963
MNAVTKPLLATLTLVAIAYGSQAQTQPAPPTCRSAGIEPASCVADTRPQWMNVESGTAEALTQQRQTVESGPAARNLKSGTAGEGTARPSSVGVLPAAQQMVAGTGSLHVEAEVATTPESQAYALILAGLGVIGLVASKRFRN